MYRFIICSVENLKNIFIFFIKLFCCCYFVSVHTVYLLVPILALVLNTFAILYIFSGIDFSPITFSSHFFLCLSHSLPSSILSSSSSVPFPCYTYILYLVFLHTSTLYPIHLVIFSLNQIIYPSLLSS